MRAEPWKTRVFLHCVEGKVGRTFPVGRAAFPLVSDKQDTPKFVFLAVHAFLRVLRDHGYVAFEEERRRPVNPVRVLADSRHPPTRA